MKVVFAGTPVFARTALEGILAAGFDVLLVLTQPDRPAGRGLQLQTSPVKQCALQHGIALAQPRSLRLDGKYPEDAQTAQACVQAARADVVVVAAYGLLLPPWLLKLPPHGCLNIHASLLPRWRGAAPIQRAIEAGDTHTGITIMHMDEGLDTGDIALAQSLPIGAHDTSADLHDQLARLGQRLIADALKLAACAALPRSPQPQHGVCHAAKISKAETLVNWRDSADTIARRVRAFNPAPGAATHWRGHGIKLWQARVDDEGAPHQATPGTVLPSAPGTLRAACGQGSVLQIEQLQRSGGKRLSASDFLRGCAMHPGDVLST